VKQNPLSSKPGERGQALAETALFSTLAVVMAFAILALIPIHRSRSVATSAAYACAQFLSQSPRPSTAVYNAYRIATETLEADWSATLGMEYNLEIVPPSGSGQPGGCAVHYRPPIFFNGLLGLQGPQWSSEWFVSRSETWKAKW
jgi:hypothetical protein